MVIALSSGEVNIKSIKIPFMPIDKINIVEKLSLYADYWNPRIAGELNNQYIKLVKFKGEFVWHKHDNEDEMFLVIAGSFTMELRDRSIELNPGEYIICSS